MRIPSVVLGCVILAGTVPAILDLSAPALAQQKTAKACQDEWRANKAANQAKGITEKAYVAQCRAGSAAAAPPAAPATAAQAPAPTAAPAAAPATPPRRTTPTAATRQAAPTGANQFTSEAQAKGRCPSDTVVWVNLDSKIYHFAGTKAYGKTKNGAYMCEKDTTAEGMRAAKNEKHPG
jgi:hypothetical protein